MAIKYIFADVDGTLGIGGIGIPEKNRLAIRKYVEEGGSFGVCTGRSPDSVKGFIGDLPINTLSVVNGGCALYDFQKGEYLDELCVEEDALHLDKLEAMTCVCSVGLDMIAIPGDTSAETIAAIIADEAAIGMINKKTTAVRVIPVPGKKVGDTVVFGGLLGYAPIMDVNHYSSDLFVKRGGRIPAPIHSLNN